MLNFTKGFIVIGLLAMLETVYAVKPIIINTPTGTTVCYVYPNGTMYCEPL